MAELLNSQLQYETAHDVCNVCHKVFALAEGCKCEACGRMHWCTEICKALIKQDRVRNPVGDRAHTRAGLAGLVLAEFPPIIVQSLASNIVGYAASPEPPRPLVVGFASNTRDHVCHIWVRDLDRPRQMVMDEEAIRKAIGEAARIHYEVIEPLPWEYLL